MSTFMDANWTATLAFLLDSAIKGGIVIVLAAGIAWLLRRESAAARHSVWTAAIVAQLLIPAFGILLPTWRVGVFDAPPVLAPDGQVAPAPSVEATESSKSAAGVPAGKTPAPAPVSGPSVTARISPLMIVAGLWILGALVVLLRLVVGTVIVSRMAVRGQRVVDEKWLGTMHRLAVTLGIKRPLTLLRGDTVGVPVTWGIVYPVVFLPADADAWPEDRRHYVLVHEMAHVKRLDAFTQLVAQMVTAIFWFNPLVWLAVSRMRRERENACDDYVLAHGTRASEYASDLLELVRSIGSRNKTVAAPAFAALAMARRSEFEGRMLSILDPEARRTSLSRARLIACTGAALVLIAPLAAFSPFDTRANTVEINPLAQRNVEPPRVDTKLPVASTKTAAPATSSSETSTTVPLTFSGAAGSPCDRISNTSSQSIHSHDDSDAPAARSIQVVRRSPGYCFEAAINGRLSFTNDDHDVRDMAPEARLRIREHTSAADREIVLVPDAGGIRREYYANGSRATYDASAQSWFSSVLQIAIRESGVDAARRVTRIAQARGSAGVMEEIGAMQSSGAKRNYYLAYLQSNLQITDGDLARLVRQAQTDLAASSGDLSMVLTTVGQRGLRGQQIRTAFGAAAESIASDGDKTGVLTQVAMTADRDMLIEVMRVARTIGSDGDKSRLLITSAARYLVGRDAELRDAYFTVVEQVGSDGDRSRVIISAAAYGSADEAVTLACIRATHTISSDGDKASVLISIVSRRLLVNQRIKDLFLAETNRISSDGDRARVLTAYATGGN